MTEMMGVYRGIRFTSRHEILGLHYVVLDDLGYGVTRLHRTLGELQAAVDAALARDEDVRLAEPIE